MGITHVTVGTVLTQAEYEVAGSHTSDHPINKNAIINGGFTINQRTYVSAATLATTVYGHDRWKAGASGGDYSFTQLASPTTITIAANKTLIQVVEDKNVYGGTYTLSWTGTCQARYAINSATPAGAYAASPIVITGQTAGTTMSVEFGNGASSGTLGLIQLELGAIATQFEFRPYGQELALCQRYYQKSYSYSIAIGAASLNGCHISGALTGWLLQMPSIYLNVQMRTSPTMAFYSPNGGGATKASEYDSASAFVADRAVILSYSTERIIAPQSGDGAFTIDNRIFAQWTATAEL